MKVRKSMTLPSSLKTNPPRSTHWQWSQPLLKDQRPLSVKPPSVTVALPVGAYDEESRVCWSPPHPPCCPSSANSAPGHGWTPTTEEPQPVEPQAPAISRTDV